MLNRSGKRRLRQAINRANQTIGRVDSQYHTQNTKADRPNDVRAADIAAFGPINNPKDRPQEPAGSAKPSENPEPNQFDRRIAGATVAIAVLTGGLFLVGAASAIIANRTVNVINGQLSEMKSSGIQTDKLIATNADLAAAAKTQGIAQEKYAATSEESFIASVRARINSNTATFDGIVPGQKIKGKMNYANVGRDAAPIDTITLILKWTKDEWNRGDAIPILIKFSKECMSKMDIVGANIAYPVYGFGGTGYYSEFSSSEPSQTNGHPFLADDGIVKGTEIVSASVCHIYKTAKRAHHTTACYFYSSETSTSLQLPNICDVGGDFD